jgi:hypothetical protein
MTMTATRSEGDHTDTTWAAATAARTGPAWSEELVELLVLAEHGDEAAATRLSGWRAVDAVAETVSAAIARDVEAVRTGSPGSTTQ